MRYSLTILLTLVLTACSSLHSLPSNLTSSEYASIIEQARNRVIESPLALSSKEVEIVKTKEPEIRYYFLARPYADYVISWVINKQNSISVSGQGNLLKLEGATVQRLDKNKI